MAAREVSFREVVLADAPTLARLIVSSNRASFQGLVPDPILEFSVEESEANWRRTLTKGLPRDNIMVLALVAGEAVGYAWGLPSKGDTLYRGELKQIMVLPNYWRRGIGRLLVRRVAERLTEQGIDSLKVEVPKLNRNRAFYERLGGRFVSERPHDWDGFVSPMYTYGWKQTRDLRGA